MDKPLHERDSAYYQELQTHTGWARTLDSFARWCVPQPGWLILDVGCGPGLLPSIFAKMGCTAVGADLDPGMFRPLPLHAAVLVANAYELPLMASIFDLITCSNLLFLLENPTLALGRMVRLLGPGCKLAMLNPSELLNETAAINFAGERQLQGVARDTLVNWARRAEMNHRWTESDTIYLFQQAGLNYGGSVLKVGPGFARFSWGSRNT